MRMFLSKGIFGQALIDDRNPVDTTIESVSRTVGADRIVGSCAIGEALTFPPHCIYR